jgi:hypothetical protein
MVAHLRPRKAQATKRQQLEQSSDNTLGYEVSAAPVYAGEAQYFDAESAWGWARKA